MSGAEERDQEDADIKAAVSMVRVPTAPSAPEDLPPYSAEGGGGSEPGLVSVQTLIWKS